MNASACPADGELSCAPLATPEGGILLEKTSSSRIVPTLDDSLSEKTLTSVCQALRDLGSSLSPAMIEGLQDLAETLESMAEGNLPPRYYLSSMDPGVGKTTLIQHYLHHLLASSSHGEVSVLVCLSRRDEVRTFVEKLTEHHAMIGVDTADGDINALAGTTPQEARILFTTQQMLEKSCRDRSFDEVSRFSYRGSPRQVRIWDESMLPGESVTVSADELLGLIDPTRKELPELAKGIEELVGELREAPANRLFQVPSAQELGGAGAHTVLSQLPGQKDGQPGEIAGRLLDLLGCVLPLRRDNLGVPMLLDIRDTLPRGFAPVVILDASGRVRHTYRLWEQDRGGLARLREVRKDYRNLTIKHWLAGGGRHSFVRDEGEERVQAIAAAIMTKPHEDWLILHHKERGWSRIIRQIKDRIPSALHGNLHFLHWGDHHGTNAYAHVSNVILAGTHFLPEIAYEGLARVAAGTPDDDKVSTARIRKTRRGEHRHNILQGLSRASVRVSQDGGVCSPCTAYIIASKGSGIGDLLPEIFPGCRVEQWQPVPCKRGKNVEAAIAYLRDHFQCDLNGDLRYTTLQKAIGILDSSNFRKTVRYHQAFQDELDRLGLEEYRDGKYTALRPCVSVFDEHDPIRPFDPEDDDLDL